jgi:DeoR/GlpR family transcriptional regulator of sugar metabolism
VLALDGAKFRRGALAVVRELSTFDVVVTDTTAPDSVLAGLRADGVEVHCA